ncbi:hypothetical protein BH11MYX1_BH11MYX1_03290 [soil metagenome]
MRPAGLLTLLALSGCGPADSGTGCKESFVAGDLVITEVFADFQAPSGGTGTDDGKEWFEIYNNTDRPVSLKGLSIVHSRPDDSKPLSHTMTEVTVAPGQYFTLGNATSDLVPAYVDYGYSADLGSFYNTGGGKLELACGDKKIDAAIYDTVVSGQSRELTDAAAPDYTLNDDQTNWCPGNTTEFETGNFGTPGAESDCQPVVVGSCSDGGVMRANVAPPVGEIVVTELLPKPTLVSSTLGQWFEIKAKVDVDLNGVGLDRANDNNIKPEIISQPECVHLAAGSYATFARNTDMTMNGGVTAIGGFTFSINPSATPDLQLVYGADVIDAVTWTTSTSGASLSLAPNATDAAANDDPTNFCNGSVLYNTKDFGTPGMANTACPVVVQPGQCLANGTPRAIVKPAAGQLVINEILSNAAGTGTDGTQEWFEITNTGATAFDLNGLTLKGTSTGNTITSTDCKSVAAAGFAVFAHSTDPATNGGLPAVDATFTFALATNVSVLDGTVVLDAVTGVAQGDGLASQLKPTNTNTVDNDVPANFCPAVAAQKYGTAANGGTPGAVNVCM